MKNLAKKLVFVYVILFLIYCKSAIAQSFDPNTWYQLTTQWQGEGKSMEALKEGGNYIGVQLLPTNNSEFQSWKIISLNNGYYRFINKAYGDKKSIDLIQDGNFFVPQISASGNYSGQNWKFTGLSGGYFRITSMWKGDGQSLDLRNDNQKNILQLSNTGAFSGQMWMVRAISTNTPTLSIGSPVGYTICASENGSYTFSNKVDVAYGGDGKFINKQGISGLVIFDNNTFGDPAPGVVKSGYFKNSTATASNLDLTDPPGTKIIYVSDIGDNDVKEVMGWIKNKVISNKLPYCWRQSYTRDAGIIANTCPPGEERDPNGALCYTACPSGYLAVGPVCWQNCPEGYVNMGPTCLRNVDDYSAPSTVASCPEGYTNMGATCFRGVDDFSAPSTVASCPSGYTNMGASCYRWQSFSSLGMGSMTCPSDRFRTGARCYVNCPAGYTNTGEFCHRDASSLSMNSMICPPDRFKTGARCYVNCKEGYTNTGEFCHRDAHVITNSSIGRGFGSVLVCPPDRIRDETGGPLGLCYERCKPGFHGVGPVCWQDCPPNWTPCGAGCASTTMECATSTIDMVTSTFILAANIATLGMAESVTAPLNAGAQTIKVGTKFVTGSTKVGKLAVKALGAIQTIGKAEQVAEKVTYLKKGFKVVNGIREIISNTKTVASSTADIIEEYETAFAEDFLNQTSQEISDEIDRQFSPYYANDIKRKWGEIQITEMAQASGLAIAQDVLAIASIADPTGVVSVISSFTKPVCQDNIIFPSLTRNYK